MKTALVSAAAIVALAGAALAQTSSPTTDGATKPAHPQVQTQTQNPPAVAPSAGQPSSGTMKSVTPAGSMQLDFYTVQAADMRASKLIGASVYDQSKERIGEVDDILIGNGNTVQALILGVGGFLGIGERNVAVKSGAATVGMTENRSVQVIVNATKEQLTKAPAVNLADLNAKATGTTSTGTTTTIQPKQ
ncbi:MAG: PRC-barrel domain-containing protein [Alphaproteobacteria bacterium]|nr:PRC-barrel domain-containing protein [Alphaproteobacteria bacterium]